MADELTLKDRCDSCNAAARVRVMVGELPLDFCGHHYRKNQEALEAKGYAVAINNTEVKEKVLTPA